jgi:hypothetical protein
VLPAQRDVLAAGGEHYTPVSPSFPPLFVPEQRKPPPSRGRLTAAEASPALSAGLPVLRRRGPCAACRLPNAARGARARLEPRSSPPQWTTSREERDGFHQAHHVDCGGKLLTACATTPPPEYTKDHPANPEAPAASMQPPSTRCQLQSFGSRSKQNADSPAARRPTHRRRRAAMSIIIDRSRAAALWRRWRWPAARAYSRTPASRTFATP